MVSALDSQTGNPSLVLDSKYPDYPDTSTTSIAKLRKEGKISDPEHTFACYLAGKLQTEVVQQFSVPAFDRKTHNKFYWHLDIFLPVYNLAIEINGQTHYTDPRQFVSDYWKQIDCTRLSIVLVSFPCFPPSGTQAYEAWCRKMFKYWSKDVEKLIEAFSYELDEYGD